MWRGLWRVRSRSWGSYCSDNRRKLAGSRKTLPFRGQERAQWRVVAQHLDTPLVIAGRESRPIGGEGAGTKQRLRMGLA